MLAPQLKLCVSATDLREEQKRNELLPIIVQQAYIISKQGRQEESAKICENVTVDRYVLPKKFFSDYRCST